MDQAPLRVLHIVTSERWSDQDAMLPALIRALRTQPGIHTDILLVDENPGQARFQDRIEAVAAHRRDSFAHRFRALARTAVAAAPHVVHAHGCLESLLGAYVAYRVDARSLRSVGKSAHAGSRLLQTADDLCRRLHTALVCPTHELGAQAACRFRQPHVTVIEPGVDVEALLAQAARPVDPAALGSGFHVGFVAPLTPRSRLDMALATAYMLNRDHPGRFRFHVFGEGETRAPCEAFVGRHRLTACVTFHGAQAPLGSWLAHMNALLVCADDDELPVRAIEAMVLGVPVVAHAVGELPRILGFGAFGTLVTEHAPYTYATSLAALAAGQAAARQRALAAARYASRQYDVGHVAHRYANLYRTLGAKNAAPPDVPHAYAPSGSVSKRR